MASVLLVDEESSLRASLVRTLEAAGHVVETAANGREAVALFQRRAYDVLILEILLPEKDGVETIMEVTNRWPGCRILAMSAGGRFLTASQAVAIAKAVGADMSLQKPFSASELVETVAALLRMRAA